VCVCVCVWVGGWVSSIWEESYAPVVSLLRRHFWYISVNRVTGIPTSSLQNSLAAFWPGLQAQLGDVELATRSMKTLFQMWRQYGCVPEGYVVTDRAVKSTQDGYPLRPEMAESLYKLYRTTGDPIWQHLALEMVYSIERVMRAPCGYAALSSVRTHRRSNLMDSFFLSETVKYLYMIFAEENVVNRRPHVFNTEAHLFPVRFALQSIAWQTPARPHAQDLARERGAAQAHSATELELCGYCAAQEVCVRLCEAANHTPTLRAASPVSSSPTSSSRPPSSTSPSASSPSSPSPSLHTFMAETLHERLRAAPVEPRRGAFYDESVASCPPPNWFQDTLVAGDFDPIFSFYEAVLNRPPTSASDLQASLDQAATNTNAHAHAHANSNPNVSHTEPTAWRAHDQSGESAAAQLRLVVENRREVDPQRLRHLMAPPLSPQQADLLRRLHGVASPTAPQRTYEAVFYSGNGSLKLEDDLLRRLFEFLWVFPAE
jgi:Glycosyl hydrolase family 47